MHSTVNDELEPRRRVHDLLVPGTVGALLLIALLLRLYFWRHTQRTWEDALITILHVENFWAGLGLTHVKPGEAPLHGFTSPLSVLVPLLAGLIDGTATHALAFQKAVSAVAGAGVVWLAYRLMLRVEVAPGMRLAWVIFALGYMAFEHHQILWGMAGMETTVVTLVLFFNFHAYAVRSPRLIAVAMALALYARPDFLFLNILGLAYCLAFLRRETARIVAIAFMLYLPWLVFTSLYYGSPIPNTIWAKMHGYGMGPRGFGWFMHLMFPLGPSFAGNGTGYIPEWDSGVVSILVFGLFIVGTYQAVARRLAVLYMPIAFVLVYWAYYFFAVAHVFGWYFVPVSATTMVVAGYGLICVFPRPGAATVAAGAYALIMLAILPSNFRAERGIQRYIENSVRQQMGLYLGQVMDPADYAGMEPLGYSSYYSRRPILDYPGLASRQVVEHQKKHPKSGLCGMLADLRPRYVALRAHECLGAPFLAEAYELVREFKAPPAADTIKRAELNVDKHFRVYRRKPPAPPPPPPPPPVPAESPNAPFP